MARITSRGKCYFCSKEFPRASMTRHLAACPARQAALEIPEGKKKPKLEKYFHIFVDGYRVYWLHIEMPASATLIDLDQFLRDIWLECCGHLSHFIMGKKRYESPRGGDYGLDWIGDSEPSAYEEEVSPPTEEEYEEAGDSIGQDWANQMGLSLNSFASLLGEFGNDLPKEYSMKTTLGKALSVGLKFEHEYDFGTTTELILTVIAERDGIASKQTPKKTKPRNDHVTILARNDPPLINCLKCGKPATKICIECQYPDGGAYCDKCAGKECPGCDDEMNLPIVNSPRMGECGYTGSPYYD